MVDLNNVTSITLDCSYSYDPGDVKLVIRWFHNKSPEPIYQWIPEPDIRYVSEMIRPYFDMEFQINQDRYGRYRALRLDLQRSRSIFGPPISLSGNYSCVISSISNQETRESQMILYVPPKIFEFNFIHYDSERIALECLVDGVYPKPILSFQEQYSQRADFSSVSLSSPSSPSSSQFDFFQHLHRNPSAVQQQSSVNVNITESDIEPFLYSASFLHPIKSILTAGTIYECKLQLPGTIYLRKKRIKIIFPTMNYIVKADNGSNRSILDLYRYNNHHRLQRYQRTSGHCCGQCLDLKIISYAAITLLMAWILSIGE